MGNRTSLLCLKVYFVASVNIDLAAIVLRQDSSPEVNPSNVFEKYATRQGSSPSL